MADIKFSCPHCNQHITCDELWGGHELQCPGCQGSLIVPGGATAPAPPDNPLVPKPQFGGKVSLTKAPAPNAPAHGAPAPPRNIPIRNLAPPAQKKQSPVAKYAITAAVLVALAAGGYFGYVWYTGRQASANAKSQEAEKKTGGGAQSGGQLAEMNTVMDGTDAGNATPAPGPARRPRPGSAPPGADSAAGAVSAAANNNQPVIPPVWTLDLPTAKIPDGRANGSISGTNFVPDTVRVDPVGTAEVLRLIQGPAISPDREVLVYLHLKAGEKLGGQTLAISQDMRGSGVPQVTKRWKTNPRYAAVLKSFSTGYAMKLELGQFTNNMVPGKIFLALPDTEQTVVAGNFNATVLLPDPNAQSMTVATPMSPDAASGAARTALEQRYGTAMRRP